ncbi:MAG: hypothetical protein RL292_155 [Candidatus Parcubacteria bacterium]|jgi:hypothetical protein
MQNRPVTVQGITQKEALMPNQEVPKKEVRLIQNPLLKLHVRPILNWHEFLNRWEATQDADTSIGLLHRGFKIPLEYRDFSEPRYTDFDRIKFYLSVADGWADVDLLCLPEDDAQSYLVGYDRLNAVYKQTSHFRQQVATKAFEILCGNFFKMPLIDEMHEIRGEWCGTVFSDELFPFIRSFFETTPDEDSPRVRIRNMPSSWKERSHYEVVVVEFLLNLTRFIWSWKEYASFSNNKEINELNEKTRARIEEAKLWTIQILIGLDRLDVLKGLVKSLGRSCMDILEANVLKMTLYDKGKFREVTSVEEALHAGSSVAQWLLYWRVINQFVERAAALARAEEELRKAQKKVGTLGRIK